MDVQAPRRRLAVFGALLATIAFGLASRRWPLPGVFAKETGDALYTVAVFFAAAFLVPAARGSRLAAFAGVASALVEASQLLQWPRLIALRHTTLGALVLGQGYSTADLVAYACGALFVWGADAVLRRVRERLCRPSPSSSELRGSQ